MRKHELREVTERAIRAAGIKPGPCVVTGGRHQKIEFEFNGRKYPIFFSNTTSDARAVKKQKCFMRRKLIEIGAIKP